MKRLEPDHDPNFFGDETHDMSEIPEHLPKRLRRRHVAAALDITPREAEGLFERGHLKNVNAQPYAWRETTPQELIKYSIRMDKPVDWEAVKREHDEDSRGL